MDDSNLYGIRPDYQANLEQNTFDAGEDVSYWTYERLSAAALFQFDVYRVAINLLRSKQYRVLADVGCGPPIKLSAFSGLEDIEIHLVDQPNTRELSSTLLPNARFWATNLEAPDACLGRKVPLIICADVIEHLINPDPCLAFIRQSLTDDGMLVISTPERDILRGHGCLSSPHPMHVREWTKDEFQSFLKSRGWAIIEHRILPQKKIASFQRLYGRILTLLGYPPVWMSCQMVICRKVGD